MASEPCQGSPNGVLVGYNAPIHRLMITLSIHSYAPSLPLSILIINCTLINNSAVFLHKQMGNLTDMLINNTFPGCGGAQGRNQVGVKLSL